MQFDERKWSRKRGMKSVPWGFIWDCQIALLSTQNSDKNKKPFTQQGDIQGGEYKKLFYNLR